jgi:hypothetical protein
MSAIANSFDANVNVGNKTNQISQVFGDLKKDTNHKDIDSDFVGANKNVGDGEFRDLMGGVFNYKHVDKDKDAEISAGDIYINDAFNLLNEMLLGNGIAGVKLVGLDGDSFTLAVDGVAGSKDFMVFEGQAAEEAIRLVDEQQGLSAGGSGFDINQDGKNQFAILDASDAANFIKVGAGGKLGTYDGPNNLSQDDLDDFLEEVLIGDGYAGVKILDVDEKSISLMLSGGGGTDTLLITGIGDILAGIDAQSNFNAARDDDNGFRFVGGDEDGGNSSGGQNNPSNDLFRSFAGGQFNENDGDGFLAALVEAGGQLSDDNETINLVGVDSDDFTIEYIHGGTTDYFVFDA